MIVRGQVDLSLTHSNTILLNDKTGPKVLELKIDDQNGYVDLSFSEEYTDQYHQLHLLLVQALLFLRYQDQLIN